MTSWLLVGDLRGNRKKKCQTMCWRYVWRKTTRSVNIVWIYIMRGVIYWDMTAGRRSNVAEPLHARFGWIGNAGVVIGEGVRTETGVQDGMVGPGVGLCEGCELRDWET